MNRTAKRQSLTAEVTEILSKMPIVKNLARKKFISQFTLGLIQSRNVQFCQVAQHLNDEAKLASNEVRIQDFFREVDLDYNFVAMLLLSLLPKGKKLRLCIDRTDRTADAVGLRDSSGKHFDGRGRIQRYNRAAVLGNAERIGLVIGDREFVGHQWFKYLKDRGINFVMRLPKHHNIHRLDGRIQTVDTLALTADKPLMLYDCLVDGVMAHVWVMLLEDGDYLFLFGTVEVKFMGQLYRKRWSIEVCFQNMKKRGFNLENTHLQDNEKLKKLVALVSIAYAFCASLGIYYHRKVKGIRKKNHGYTANSFVRRGIDLVQEWCRAENYMPDKVLNRVLCFIRYLRMLTPDPHSLKIVG